MAKIIFTSKVKGEITTVYASANGEPLAPKISSGVYSVDYTGNLPAGTVLQVIYKLVGMNGTDYSIEYKCSADGVQKSDPVNVSPINGTIKTGDNIIVMLNIKL